MNQHITIIKPRDHNALDLKELIRFRDLFYIFALRDLKVRYKQTLLGIVWTVIQPILSAGVFTVFFGKLAQIPSGELPYSIFIFAGLVFWYFFANALSKSTDSLIANESILKKAYFPKIILPFSAVVGACIDFFINFMVLLLILFITGVTPKPLFIITVLLGVVITFITATGLGLLLSSVNAKYRDVRYVIPFFTQLLLFVSPVIYPLSIVGTNHRLLMALNPMTAVIESVRLTLTHSRLVDTPILLISTVSGLVIFTIGYWYFCKTEKFFADII